MIHINSNQGYFSNLLKIFTQAIIDLIAAMILIHGIQDKIVHSTGFSSSAALKVMYVPKIGIQANQASSTFNF